MSDVEKFCPKCGATLYHHDIFRDGTCLKNYYCQECNWPTTVEDFAQRNKLRLADRGKIKLFGYSRSKINNKFGIMQSIEYEVDGETISECFEKAATIEENLLPDNTIIVSWSFAPQLFIHDAY